MQLIWREVPPQPFIIEVTSHLHFIAAAFFPSSHPPSQSAACFRVRLIKLLSPVVCNCLIRVLIIIVIKKSSVHFRKKRRKKYVFFSTCMLWFIRTDRPQKTEEKRGCMEPLEDDAIARIVSHRAAHMIRGLVISKMIFEIPKYLMSSLCFQSFQSYLEKFFACSLREVFKCYGKYDSTNEVIYKGSSDPLV